MALLPICHYSVYHHLSLRTPFSLTCVISIPASLRPSSFENRPWMRSYLISWLLTICHYLVCHPVSFVIQHQGRMGAKIFGEASFNLCPNRICVTIKINKLIFQKHEFKQVLLFDIKIMNLFQKFKQLLLKIFMKYYKRHSKSLFNTLQNSIIKIFFFSLYIFFGISFFRFESKTNLR